MECQEYAGVQSNHQTQAWVSMKACRHLPHGFQALTYKNLQLICSSLENVRKSADEGQDSYSWQMES